MDVTMLINKTHPLPESFRPDGLIDLFSVEDRRFFLPPKRMLLESSAARALNRMCAAAEREAGLTEFQVFSAWRSREEQAHIYRYRRRDGYVALPGCSEHESGLAIDIEAAVEDIDRLHLDWLEKNSWRYGYIQRYPAGRERITGISFEPWHFRYVGEALAAVLFQSKWTLEEYHDRSIPPYAPYEPAYIFLDIFGTRMKGHWQNWPDIDLEELRAVNPEAVGWVHMEGTPIDYPVVGPALSSAWCLKYNFSGEPSAHGMIRLEQTRETDDLLLTGHHMLDTSMFMKLDEIRKAGSFDAYPMIELNLEGIRYTARWFAAHMIGYGERPSMPPSRDPAERGKWLQKIRGSALFVSEPFAGQEDRILACSTCANHAGRQLTVLYAAMNPV